MTLLALPAPVRTAAPGFWAVAFAFLTTMAFSTVPTPLYPLYVAREGFSTFTVTVVFAAYALGVVASLLVAGPLSDRVGRRAVLVPALGLELLAALLFLTSTSLPALLLARLLNGLGVGVISSTATAYLQELNGRRFETVSTAANLGGLGLGTLVAGFLAQFVDAPLRTPYVLFAVLLVLSTVAVALTPETVSVRQARPARRVALGSPAAGAAGFAAFAVFGLFTSLAPAFVAGTLHHPSRALAGAVVFAVFASATAAQLLTRHLPERPKARLGLLAQAVGVLTLTAGVHLAGAAWFLVGGVVAGAGAGLSFKAAVGAVARTAAPAARAAALAGLFLVSYLGMVVPALGIGVAARTVPLATALTGFAVLHLFVLATAAALNGRRGLIKALMHGPTALR
ncbi:MFS transporter [Virgisporangium aliadipatigenens]|uniref:MFS transporter n=1 Tax=Virgisporangium aliadipatigenens TaxID=741659 RepID=A0A8J4DMK3_9ACTN|nr:MFS transporter [Virgisporangium aliadipatigenens]GIJ43479.1 MFS transporter [Virgisporangium aliadipatigenens]